MEFCDISRPEHATPPALEALPGAKTTLFSRKYSTASGGRHIRSLTDREAAVGDEHLRGISVKLVLCRAGQGDIALHGPDRGAALCISGIRMNLDILADSLALDFLDHLDRRQVDAVFIVDVAGRIAHRNALAAQLLCLLGRVDCHVAGAGDDDGRACKRIFPLCLSSLRP